MLQCRSPTVFLFNLRILKNSDDARFSKHAYMV